MIIPIYSSETSNWQDLQNRVAKVFKDLGFDSVVEADIETVRGKVNVDVLATKGSPSVREIYIGECKFWSVPVPKSVVHSFRTVINDYGANAGFLISKMGFQSGSIDAAKNSNVYLMTFDEFQTEFKVRWLNAVIEELYMIGYPLRRYCDYTEDFVDKELILLSKEKQEQYGAIRNKYDRLSIYSNISLSKSVIDGQIDVDWVNHIVEEKSLEIFGPTHATSLMDYYDYMKEFCRQGVEDFDNLFGKKLRKR